eukprot:9327049-Pyramimonas_sp.AAC.1
MVRPTRKRRVGGLRGTQRSLWRNHWMILFDRFAHSASPYCAIVGVYVRVRGPCGVAGRRCCGCG